MPFDSFVDTLETLAASGDQNELDALWTLLVAGNRVPYVEGEKVAFLYRGEASSVGWAGDFSYWERGQPLVGSQVGQSDIWVAYATFPTNARLDYLIVVDGQKWELDPANPVQQWGGYGPRSVLAMPDYRYPSETVERPGVQPGHLSAQVSLESAHLNYSVNHQVYLPAGYEDLAALPVIYATDGHEFVDARAGAMVTVLDNLIGTGRIEPVLAVFIDPRDPDIGLARRETEFLGNPAYQAFIATELVPAVDSAYRSAPTARRRAILGVSYGAVNAAACGLFHPEVFDLVAMLSPCFPDDAIYAAYRSANQLPRRFFLSSGYPWDCDARTMKGVLGEKEVALTTRELPEGHSWGQWRSLIDDMLTCFFGPSEQTASGAR